MNRKKGLMSALSIVGFLLLGWAPQAAADDEDPPSRVARLNYIQGSVSFNPAGEEEWVGAVPNRPMTTGDRIWADNDSRVEMHIGGTALRLDQKTGMTFLDLDDRSVQIRLSEGTLIVHLRHLGDDETFEVDTPNLAFSVLRPGLYRLHVSEDGSRTIIEVRHGQGEVTGGGRAFNLVEDQRAALTGADTLDFDLTDIDNLDGFDRWSDERDSREDRSHALHHVSPEMTGYEDLDEAGDWRFVSGYGTVWVPTAVVIGWAPYRFGHWVWIEPWGWTWVEDEPWGFAPFHYGRWVYVGSYWAWVPGPVVVRPVYAPALVVFVGGPRFSLSFSFGSGPAVAWFPLAPREIYVPAYHVSERYVTNINVTNTTVNNIYVTNVYRTYVTNTTVNNVNVTNVKYVNEQVPGATTAVSRETFVNARPVAKEGVAVAPKDLEKAEVTPAARFAPAKPSVMGAGTVAAVKPPAAVMNRPVISKRTPPPPPMPIARKQSFYEANPGRPPAHSAVESVRPPEMQTHPLVKPAPPVESKSQKEWESDEAKYRAWQAKHEKKMQTQEQRSQQEEKQRKQEEQKEEKPHPDRPPKA